MSGALSTHRTGTVGTRFLSDSVWLHSGTGPRVGTGSGSTPVVPQERPPSVTPRPTPGCRTQGRPFVGPEAGGRHVVKGVEVSDPGRRTH